MDGTDRGAHLLREHIRSKSEHFSTNKRTHIHTHTHENQRVSKELTFKSCSTLFETKRKLSGTATGTKCNSQTVRPASLTQPISKQTIGTGKMGRASRIRDRTAVTGLVTTNTSFSQTKPNQPICHCCQDQNNFVHKSATNPINNNTYRMLKPVRACMCV